MRVVELLTIKQLTRLACWIGTPFESRAVSIRSYNKSVHTDFKMLAIDIIGISLRGRSTRREGQLRRTCLYDARETDTSVYEATATR